LAHGFVSGLFKTPDTIFKGRLIHLRPPTTKLRGEARLYAPTPLERRVRRRIGDETNMRIAMTTEEALEFADEWSRGLTLHEGSQGWRVVCMLLAEEVRRRHGIGGELITARRERDELAAAIQQTLDENGHLADGENCTLIVLKRALMGPNV